VLKIKSKNRERYVSGTLYSKKDPRIIEIDNFKVEIVPEGELLLIYNNDKPGVIGNIGNTLGRHNINIARMHFGRESAGGMAISVVSLDIKPGPEVIEQLKVLPNILSITQISL
jgi:D-3-phosphoglycerate dehydrogenase